jgi:hypothetical protein
MKIQEAIVRVRLRSESEAVALDLPPEMGVEVYDGIVADDVNGWSEDVFVGWCADIEAKYGVEWGEWRELYGSISKIMGEYAPLIEAS